MAKNSDWTRVERNVPRPFRIWSTADKKDLRWRYYSDPRRAQIGALIEVRWAKVDETLEVYDARTAKFLCSYTRRAATILFQEA